MEDTIVRSLSAISNETGKKVDQGFSRVGNDISQIKESLAEISSLSALTQQAHSDTTLAVAHLLDGQTVHQTAAAHLLNGQQAIVKGQRTIGDGVQTSSKAVAQICSRLDEVKNNQNQLKKTLSQSMAAHVKQGTSLHSLLVKNEPFSKSNKSSQLVPQGRATDLTDLNSDLSNQMQKIMEDLINKRSQSQPQRDHPFSRSKNFQGSLKRQYRGGHMPCRFCNEDHPFWQHPGLDNSVNCVWEELNSEGKCRAPATCKMNHDTRNYTAEELTRTRPSGEKND